MLLSLLCLSGMGMAMGQLVKRHMHVKIYELSFKLDG